MRKITISKDLLLRWRDRITWIQNVKFSSQETEEVRSKRIRRARKDYAFFVSYYFSDSMPDLKKNAKFHNEAAEIVKKCKNIKMLLEWARGHAKSSHA